MKRNYILTFMTISLLLSLFGCSKKTAVIKSYIGGAGVADMSEYTELTNADGFASITKEQLIASIGDKNVNAIIYMGFSGCSNCQKAIKSIQDAAIKAEQTVYYLDLTAEIVEDTDYDEIYNALESILTIKGDDTEPQLYTPQVFVIVGGELYRGYIGYDENFNYSDLMDIEAVSGLMK